MSWGDVAGGRFYDLGMVRCVAECRQRCLEGSGGRVKWVLAVDVPEGDFGGLVEACGGVFGFGSAASGGRRAPATMDAHGHARSRIETVLGEFLDPVGPFKLDVCSRSR